MAHNSKPLLKDANNIPIAQVFDQANDVYVPTVKMEYYGKSTDPKPLPNKTPLGATYMEVDTLEIYMNDSVQWVVI